jgi:two-component system sensor histidine kinase RegB
VGEPFFTTRGPGEGLGLGVFFARTVTEQLGGRFEIDSRLGQGTTVTMRLPRPTQSEARPSRG